MLYMLYVYLNCNTFLVYEEPASKCGGSTIHIPKYDCKYKISVLQIPFLLTILTSGGKKPAYGTQGSTAMVTRWQWERAVAAETGHTRTVQVIT